LRAVAGRASARGLPVKPMPDADPTEAVALAVLLQGVDIGVEPGTLATGGGGHDQVQVQDPTLLGFPDLRGNQRAGTASAAGDLRRDTVQLRPAGLCLSIPSLRSTRNDTTALRTAAALVLGMRAAGSIPDKSGVLARSRNRHQRHGVQFEQTTHQQVPPVLRPEPSVGRTRAAATPLPAV